jgi:hypothetical protein
LWRKKGDFNGVASDGSIQGLLFPASVVFSPNKSRLYITNLALYLPFAGVPTIAVDSGWTRQVQHNIAMIDIPQRNNHGRRGLCPANRLTPTLRKGELP